MQNIYILVVGPHSTPEISYHHHHHCLNMQPSHHKHIILSASIHQYVFVPLSVCLSMYLSFMYHSKVTINGP